MRSPFGFSRPARAPWRLATSHSRWQTLALHTGGASAVLIWYGRRNQCRHIRTVTEQSALRLCHDFWNINCYIASHARIVLYRVGVAICSALRLSFCQGRRQPTPLKHYSYNCWTVEHEICMSFFSQMRPTAESLGHDGLASPSPNAGQRCLSGPSRSTGGGGAQHWSTCRWRASTTRSSILGLVAVSRTVFESFLAVNSVDVLPMNEPLRRVVRGACR